MFARRATQLLKDSQRTEEDQILPYDADAVSEVLGEIKEHVREINGILRRIERGDANNEEMLSCSAAIIVHHCSIKRNKRCMLAFLAQRLERLKAMRWHLGSFLPENIEEKMSSQEKESFKAYSDSLSDYMASIDLDLTLDAIPPKDPFVEVKVLKDTGPIVINNKVVHLTPNSVHLFKRPDVEQLITQGFLEHRKF